MNITRHFYINTKIIHRFYSSALFITGDKATTNCALLTPYVDFKQYVNNFDALADNVKQRRLDVDFHELRRLWNLYEDLDNTKQKLDLYRINITNKIKELKDKNIDNTNEVTKLINNGKIVRDDLKALKECFQPIQENLVLQILHLPNVIHDLTPLDVKVITTYLEKPKKTSKHHTIIGQKLKQLNYINANTYYLTNEAALMELNLLSYFNKNLDNNNFIPFCLPDFARTAIVEGCGIDYEHLDAIFTLKDPEDTKSDISKLHLTGSASLFAFMAYHTKLMLYPSVFPIHYYSSGRQYLPSTSISEGLFAPSQSSCVHIFTATLNDKQKMEQQFFDIITLCTDIYKALNYHFRVIYQPAFELHKSECLRVSFQMYSSHFQKYIEVGYVSMYDDYLSKRLLFTYKEGKVNVFPKVISGTVVNFAKLLGCVLESNSEQFVVPDVLCKDWN